MAFQHARFTRRALLHEAVGSYSTFSPLPRMKRDGYFLWHCLYHEARATMTPALNRYIALCCPDFPSRMCGTMARPVAGANLEKYLGSPVTVPRIVLIDE